MSKFFIHRPIFAIVISIIIVIVGVLAGLQLPIAQYPPAGVSTVKSSSDMSFIFALYCDNERFDRTFIKNYADIYLLDTIQRVDGVGNVQVFGADYAMRIWLNPEKLAAYNLVVSDVISAIKLQNSQAAAGTIGSMPVNQGQEKQYTGKIQGRMSTPEEFENIILKTGESGSFLRLKDVARVEVGQQNSNTITKFNGKPAIGFAVSLTSDANAMETISEVKKILADS